MKKNIKENIIHIDSSRRLIESTNNYIGDFIALDFNPLRFQDGTSTVTISYVNDDSLKVGMTIMLTNVTPINTILNSALTIKTNSTYARIHHQNHNLSVHLDNIPDNYTKVSYVDDLPTNFNPDSMIADSNKQYYILKGPSNISIKINLMNDNKTFDPIMNDIYGYNHQVYLLYTLIDGNYIIDRDNYLIKLPSRSTKNYRENSDIHIQFNELFGVPVSRFDNNLIIDDVSDDYFTVDIGYPAVVTDDVDGMGGGSSIYLRIVDMVQQGYPNSNDYVYELSEKYQNVVGMKILSTIFPNSQQVIYSTDYKSNNKLYWRNIDSSTIFNIEIEPGNYSTERLRQTIIDLMNGMPRKTNTDGQRYDPNGNYNYHLFDLDIDEVTNIVTFQSYRRKKILSGLLVPPDTIRIQFNNLIPNIKQLYIVMTDGSAGQNLYQYVKSIGDYIEAKINLSNALILNFSVKKPSDKLNYTTIKRSIGSSFTFDGVMYDSLNNIMSKTNHGLNQGDIIVTDQLINFVLDGAIKVYVVSEIISDDEVRIVPNNKIKIIYDNIMINFTPGSYNYLSDDDIIDITTSDNSTNMIVNHPNHGLAKNTQIRISNSHSVGRVPYNIINKNHIISKIIDQHNYLVKLDPYTSLDVPYDSMSEILITYPDRFQLLFNYADTIGDILSFPNVGQPNAITDFSYKISNADSNNRPKQLKMTGEDYFYLCCEELSTGKYIGDIPNVIAMIKLTDMPGTVIYDSFVQFQSAFNPPLPSVYKLSIKALCKDGMPFDFNGLDHTMTIMLYSY